MNHILTLICNPHHTPLSSDMVSTAQGLLGRCGEPAWLDDGTACDITFGDIDPKIAEQSIRDHFAGVPMDVAVQRAENRRKRLLIADMDSTIVTGETLDELAEFAGCKEAVVNITRRAMNGEIDFAGALRERVALLKGLPADSLEKTYELIDLTPGAETLVRTMRTFGAKTMLVSGGFTYFTERVSRRVGFDGNKGNVLELSGGVLSGQVIDPILDKDSKLRSLQEFTTAFGLTADDTLAVGDGANDLPMIMAAGLGVAYHAKPVVAEQARTRIEHGDLTALLYLQGYRKSDFVDH